MEIAFHIMKSSVTLGGKEQGIGGKQHNLMSRIHFGLYSTCFVTKPTIFLSLFWHRER